MSIPLNGLSGPGEPGCVIPSLSVDSGPGEPVMWFLLNLHKSLVMSVNASGSSIVPHVHFQHSNEEVQKDLTCRVRRRLTNNQRQSMSINDHSQLTSLNDFKTYKTACLVI